MVVGEAIAADHDPHRERVVAFDLQALHRQRLAIACEGLMDRREGALLRLALAADDQHRHPVVEDPRTVLACAPDRRNLSCDHSRVCHPKDSRLHAIAVLACHPRRPGLLAGSPREVPEHAPRVVDAVDHALPVLVLPALELNALRQQVTLHRLQREARGEGHVFVRRSVEKPVMPLAARDAEDVHHVCARVRALDDTQRSAVEVHEVGVGALAAGFCVLHDVTEAAGGHEVAVGGGLGAGAALVIPVHGHEIVREAADGERSHDRVGVADVADEFTTAREERQVQRVEVRVAVSSAEMQVRLQPLRLSPDAEHRVAHAPVQVRRHRAVSRTRERVALGCP